MINILLLFFCFFLYPPLVSFLFFLIFYYVLGFSFRCKQIGFYLLCSCFAGFFVRPKFLVRLCPGFKKCVCWTCPHFVSRGICRIDNG